MPTTSIPLERLLFGNDHWSSYNAIDEMEIYSDLLDNLEDQINSLETHGKDEEVALTNVKAVISSYAGEIAMKSLWALDNPSKRVPHTHDLIKVFCGLNDETVRSLKRLGRDDAGTGAGPYAFPYQQILDGMPKSRHHDFSNTVSEVAYSFAKGQAEGQEADTAQIAVVISEDFAFTDVEAA